MYFEYYGYEFTINGIQCTAPTNGPLQVGDYVEVTYFPRVGIFYILIRQKNHSIDFVDKVAHLTTKYDYNDSDKVVRSEVYNGEGTDAANLQSRMRLLLE